MKFHCQRRLSCSPTECAPWTTEATTQGTSLLSVEIPRYRLWLPNVYESKPPLENKAGSRSAHKINTCIKGTGNLEWRAPSVLKYNGAYNSDNLKQTNGLTSNVFVTSRDLNANYNTKCSCDDVSCYKNHLYSKVYNTFLQKGSSSSAPSEDLHDNEQMDAYQNSLLELSSRQGHMCLYCGKFYSRKYGLKIHLRTHTGYKPLKCKICKRPFGDPSNLNKHVRLHADGDTPYKCKFCGKVLVRRRDLARHIKSRHPESC